MERTHVVSLYTAPEPGRPYAPKPGWTLATEGVPANLQPLTGSVQQTAAGRAIEADWKGFVPAGTAVVEGMGVVKVSGPGPLRFRVRQVGEQGDGWDTEILLQSTAEEFGG